MALDPGLVPQAIYADGSILAPLSLRAGSARPTWYAASEKRTAYILARLNGTLMRVVGWSSELATRECIVEVTFTGGGGSAIPIPYCARAAAGVVSDGSRLVTVTPEPGNGIYVVAVTSAGDTVLSRRHRFPVYPIAKSVLDSARRAMRDGPGLRFASTASREKVAEAMSRVRLPRPTRHSIACSSAKRAQPGSSNGPQMGVARGSSSIVMARSSAACSFRRERGWAQRGAMPSG